MIEQKKINITNREFEFLFWLSNGLTTKEIAREMNISPRTVEDHVRHVRLKTNLTKRSQLVNFFASIANLKEKEFFSHQDSSWANFKSKC